MGSMRWRVALWVATLAAAASAPSAGGRTPGGCRGHRGVGPAPARPGRLRWRLALDPPCTHGHLRLRGGGESASGRLGRWHSKFPLGMALYEAAGGVGPGPGDTWLDRANMTRIHNLLDRGAKVNFEGPGRYTPLHFAASRGFVDAVTLLVDHGANVNATNKWFWTPLHIAAAGGHTEVVKVLARRGADLLARTVHTNLPLDEATGSHHWKTASVLKHLMGPNWYSFARKSYHEDPAGQYTYDRMETMTDDEIALYWQSTVRDAMGPDKFSKMFEDCDDPLSAMKIEIDPSLRDEVGWVDSDGDYHAPWEDEDEQPVSSVGTDSALEDQPAEQSDLLV